MIPAWAAAKEGHRRGELPAEQATELAARVDGLTKFPRGFGIVLIALGAASLIAAAAGAPPRVAWIVGGAQMLLLGALLRLIVVIRFGAVRASLRAGKVEGVTGLVTGTFGFGGRGPGLELLVGVEHVRHTVLCPSPEEKHALQRALDEVAASKTPLRAYRLAGTRTLVAVEP